MSRQQNEVRLLFFEIDGRAFALRLLDVQEVVPIVELLRSPDCPPVVEGFLNLRSSVIPVIRLDRLMGLSLEQGLYTPIIVLKGRPRPIACLVQRISDIQSVPEGQLESLEPEDSLNGVAEAAISIGEHRALLLDGSRLLLAYEERLLGDWTDLAAQRLAQWTGSEA